MKVIFLDFDGVINNWNTSTLVDEENVRILKMIIKESNAKIVATTSNKYPFQRNKNCDITSTIFYKYLIELNKMGVFIYGVTELIDCNRTNEIIDYLKRHKEIEQFVILDDELVEEELIEHQVYLDLYRGLKLEHIKPALDILNGNLGFYPENYDRNETSFELILRINRYYNKM